MSNRTTVLALLLVLGATMALGQMSGTYTLRPSGGDYSNFGAFFTALRTQGVAGACTLLCYTGNYTVYGDAQNIPNGSNPIVVRAAPGELPVQSFAGYGFRCDNSNWLSFEGLRIASGNYSFYLNNQHHVRIIGCQIANTGGYGIYMLTNVDTSMVRDCQVTVNSYGIYVSTNCDVDSFVGNSVTTTSSYAIYHMGSATPASFNHHNVFANNMLYGPQYGILLQYADYPELIYNSVRSGTQQAIWIYDCTNAKLLNNIFQCNSGLATYRCRYNPGVGEQYPTVSDYNCVKNVTGSYTMWRETGGSGNLGNLAWWQTQSGKDMNSLETSPAYTSDSDLHLQDGSPCIAEGTPVAGFTRDIDGNPRHASTPCIGADEAIGDIAVTSILSPGAMVPIGSPFTPQARIAHVSGPATTFGAVMEIRKAGTLVYSGTSDFVSLGTGGVDTLDLAPPCTLTVSGTDYTAACWHTGAPDRGPTDDTASTTFMVGNVDVEAYQITAPTASVMLGATVNPQVRLINRGDFAATAQVYFIIDDLSDAEVYSSTQSSASINPGDTATVDFSFPWTATPAGNYQARANVVVAYDTDPSNDSLEFGFQVIPPNADVGVAQIIQPGTLVDTNVTFTPTAKWHNYNATDPVTFTAWFKLESPTLGLFYNETVTITGLGAGMDTTLSFTDVSVGMDTGNWMARCSTYVAGDINHANDVASRAFVVAAKPPFPEGWHEVASMPLLPSNKAVKRGGWLDIDNGLVYAAKGYKTGDFYRYDPVADTWTQLADILPGAEAKMPEKGCRGLADGSGNIYMTKGNNTFGFWHYSVADNAWTPLADVPAGPSGKKVKGGTDLAYVVLGDTGFVYMLKGYKTEFWRYNTMTGAWEARANAPTGIKEKWDKGSWMAYDGANTLYAHKSKYYSGTNHEMWAYDIALDQWGTTALKGVPLAGLHGGKIKNKKSKEDAAGAYYSGLIYALKGGNTQMFYKYDCAADTWTETDTVPTVGTTGKKKRVKSGADIAAYGGGVFFALKGNKTLEAWRYVIPTGVAQRPERSGVMAGTVKSLRTGIQLGPNPLTGGYATLRYSLPKAGAATVSVFDVTGRNVMERSLVTQVTGSVSLDMRSLSAGIYLVRLDADDYSATHKLVIQH